MLWAFLLSLGLGLAWLLLRPGTELAGNVCKVRINGRAVKIQSGTIDATPTVSKISNTETGQYGGNLAVERPLKISLRQASLDPEEELFGDPLFLYPMNSVYIKVWQNGYDDFPWDCPVMVLSGLRNEFTCVGDILQPVNLEFVNNGPWAFPGEENPDVPGSPSID